METPLSSTTSASAGKRRRRNLLMASRGKSRSLVRNPQLEDPNHGGGGRECRDASVYLALCRGYWVHRRRSDYYSLHKVNVKVDWEEEDSSSSAQVVAAAAARRVAKLETDVRCKTFVSVQSRWIVGVGGDLGGTVIWDTKTGEAIPGPKLVAAKSSPVVAAVGYRVFALSATPSFVKAPDFVPWFEVLDLSKAMDVDGHLSPSLFDRRCCSWEALPCPPFFPCKLPMEYYREPPSFAVTSYVVVGHYMLLSLYGPDKFNGLGSSTGTYAFDTRSDKWLKVDRRSSLPFVGPATPHGLSGHIFLALSQRNGPINAYHISVSTSSSSKSSTMAAGASDNGGALKLSISTVFSVKDTSDEPEQVGVWTGLFFTSLDRACFSTLCYRFDNRERFIKYCRFTDEHYSRRLYVKLRTYQISTESLTLLESLDAERLPAGVMPEIAISKQREQVLKISSAHGFCRPPIASVLSIQLRAS